MDNEGGSDKDMEDDGESSEGSGNPNILVYILYRWRQEYYYIGSAIAIVWDYYQERRWSSSLRYIGS
jgi:hypothetical protein